MSSGWGCRPEVAVLSTNVATYILLGTLQDNVPRGIVHWSCVICNCSNLLSPSVSPSPNITVRHRKQPLPLKPRYLRLFILPLDSLIRCFSSFSLFLSLFFSRLFANPHPRSFTSRWRRVTVLVCFSLAAGETRTIGTDNK